VLSLAALSLAGTAAYFSIFGLSKLFYAAGLGITILAASLEFAKLVTVSYVYRFWKSIKKGLRGFYIFAVVFIMLLTSIGIYGFLTGAYQQSANKLEMRDSQIKMAENKKNLFVGQLDRVNKSIESSNERINTLSGLRTQQEKRLDNLYEQKYITVAKRAESQITGSDDQIKLLNQDITDKMKQTTSINDSIAFYDQKILDLKSSDISNEVGPYKFVADLTGASMNKVVNIVALLIVLVFDPLAIALLIGVNQLTMTIIAEVKKEDEPELDTEPIEPEPDLVEPEPDLVEPEPIESEPIESEPIESEPIEPEPIEPEPEVTVETVENNFSDPDSLKIGMIVDHQRFGRGEIVDIENSVSGNSATVLFESGEKQLFLKYAKLRIVELDMFNWNNLEAEPKVVVQVNHKDEEKKDEEITQLTTHHHHHHHESINTSLRSANGSLLY
jgi:hypothetical protein